MRGKSIPGPIRDDNPCRTCTSERHTACQDTCEKLAKWKAEIARVNENRRKYAYRLGVCHKSGK